MSIQDGNYVAYVDGSDPVYVTLARGRIVRQVCAGELALHTAARDGRDAIANGIEHAIPTADEAAIAALLDPDASPECVQVYRLVAAP